MTEHEHLKILPYNTVETYEESGSAVHGYKIDENFIALAGRIKQLEQELELLRKTGY